MILAVFFKKIILLFSLTVRSFSAFTLLVGWQEGRPACKMEWRGTGVIICLEQSGNDLHMVQLIPLSSHHVLLE